MQLPLEQLRQLNCDSTLVMTGNKQSVAPDAAVVLRLRKRTDLLAAATAEAAVEADAGAAVAAAAAAAGEALGGVAGAKVCMAGLLLAVMILLQCWTCWRLGQLPAQAARALPSPHLCWECRSLTQ